MTELERQLTAALEKLSGQFETEQRRHSEQVEALQQRFERQTEQNDLAAANRAALGATEMLGRGLQDATPATYCTFTRKEDVNKRIDGPRRRDASVRGQYDALKAKLQAVGFIGQGSVQTRRIACGSPTCRCHHDPDARHGPYHYWTRKARGKTVGLKLTEDELGLYREWIENNRELERLVKEMRRVSSRVLALITGRQAP